MALGECFNKVLGTWAVTCQCGFIRGRVMIGHVIKLEQFSMQIATDSLNQGAIILLDFSSAFPSIARLFIWIALSAIGIPSRIISCIQALFCNNMHFIRTRTGYRFVFTALSGVGQGNPLSSILFVLVTDCINRYLQSQLCIGDSILSYADDVALVLKCLWASGTRLA